jgi:hypothetical protein
MTKPPCFHKDSGSKPPRRVDLPRARERWLCQVEPGALSRGPPLCLALTGKMLSEGPAAGPLTRLQEPSGFRRTDQDQTAIDSRAAASRHRLGWPIEEAGRFIRRAAYPGSRRRQQNGEKETAAREPPFRSPSRFRFRPPAPLTFGFRLLPSLPASTYLRSVLGAGGNLGEVRSLCKRSRERKNRNLQGLNYPHFHSKPCSLWKCDPGAPLQSRTCRTCPARRASTTA